MKKILITVPVFLFLATTFSSNPSPGWYQQHLPISDQINDMFFFDSLNGWMITAGEFNSNDTAYIMHTTNGGSSWSLQYSKRENLLAVQFLDLNTGYACGGTNGTTLMTILKTTNGGNNWQTFNNLTGIRIEDIHFISNDTGWVCSSDIMFGGLWKTTNGGQNWTRQLDQTYKPAKIFFINKDTGWIGNVIEELYKTTNGGSNWNLQFTFEPGFLKDILFINKDSGWVSVGNENKVHFSSNGGNNWVVQFLPPEGGLILYSRPGKLSTVDGKTIWTVGGNLFFGMGRVRGIIYKSTNSGNNWYYQLPDTSINIPVYTNIHFINDSVGWAAYTGMIHTVDAGGPVVNINNNNLDLPKDFILYQNYPNPFNPNTIIKYQITSFSKVVLKVYDVNGVEISELINENQSAGVYEYTFDGSDLPSGIYFYRLEAIGDDIHYIETKKMLLIK